jgi:hypothetical protein
MHINHHRWGLILERVGVAKNSMLGWAVSSVKIRILKSSGKLAETVYIIM